MDCPHYPYSLNGEVCVISRCLDKKHVAVGYSNGDICIFNLIAKTLVSTLHGHHSSVVCLNMDPTIPGLSLMASGGSDSDIYLWDLVSFTAVGKLRGHKDVVTSVAILLRGSQRLVVSSSKDTLLKVWDLDSQHCIQTVVGHRSEIWSLAVIGGSSSSRVITGSADDMLRGYRVRGVDESAAGSGSGGGGGGALLGDDEKVLEYYGCIQREVSGSDRCMSLSLNTSETILAAQSSGKIVEASVVVVVCCCGIYLNYVYLCV